MRISLCGYKLKYGLANYKIKDESKIKYPRYHVYHQTLIFIDDKWTDCAFYVLRKKDGKYLVRIGATSWKNGQSDLGVVDEHGTFMDVKLSRFNRLLISLFDTFYLAKIKTFKSIDRLRPIRKNLYLILIALLVASTYYFVNLFFDNFLQNLINKSNLVQSLIVFLSISSLINIFHPFSFRREISIQDVNDIATLKSEKSIENHEKEKELNKGANIV